jgi:hypothetical protein
MKPGDRVFVPCEKCIECNEVHWSGEFITEYTPAFVVELIDVAPPDFYEVGVHVPGYPHSDGSIYWVFDMEEVKERV